MIFSYFQFLVYILFFNTQRLKQSNVLFCCCPREQFGVKVATFMLTNTILQQLFLCPTAASAQKRIADTPCSDVTPLRLWGSSASPKRIAMVQTYTPCALRCMRRANGVTRSDAPLARICCLHDAASAMMWRRASRLPV